MTTTNPFQSILSAMLLACTVLIFGTNANAASCRGKTRSACSTASDCYWVGGYKRKDGVKVSSHCRAKAGKSESMKKATSSSAKKKKKNEKVMDKAKSKSNKKAKEAKEGIDNKKKKLKKEKNKAKKDKKS